MEGRRRGRRSSTDPIVRSCCRRVWAGWLDQTAHLDAETARQVADVALERAGRVTTGQLRARIRRLVIAVDPDSARERYEAKLVERRVVIEATETGRQPVRIGSSSRRHQCRITTDQPARPGCQNRRRSS